LKKNIKYTIGERRKGDLERLVAVPTKANNILQWKAKKTLNDMC
jgi:UDP-glucose 4-epimerase